MLLVIVLNYQKYKSVRQNNNYTINKLNLYIYIYIYIYIKHNLVYIFLIVY